jgi:hypothetical protein
MKYIGIRLICALTVMFAMSSCLKDDVMPFPTMAGVQMYMIDQNGKDSLVTELVAGRAVIQMQICVLCGRGESAIL